MHDRSMQLMTEALYRMDNPEGTLVLDVGSYDVNGTYRPLVECCGSLYVGLDIRNGPNVDIVAENPYCYPFDTGQFDTVICGNMLHNVERPWLLIPEMARVLRKGGLLAVVTVWRWGLNSHPIDYFRFTDSGLGILFDSTNCLRDYQFRMDDDGNTMGSAIKA